MFSTLSRGKLYNLTLLSFADLFVRPQNRLESDIWGFKISFWKGKKRYSLGHPAETVIFILRIIQYVVDHERVKQPPPEELEGFMNLHQDSVNAFSFKELNRPLKSL